MLNEWQEFLDYTGAVTYTGNKNSDTSYMGRFTFDTILDFKGLARVFTIIARGYMYHDKNGGLLTGVPGERVDYVRKALCAWCSVSDSAKAVSRKTRLDKSCFAELHELFPELVDAEGSGWFHRHVHSLARFVLENPERVRKTVVPKAEAIEAKFDAAWRNKVIQFQVPLFSENTKGAWVIRFDDVIAEALQLGPLKNFERELSTDIIQELSAFKSRESPLDVMAVLLLYYMAHHDTDTDWVVLPVVNFEAYFGTAFGRKYLPNLPKQIFERSESGYGISRYRVTPEFKTKIAEHIWQS